MTQQQKAFKYFARSATVLRGRVAALETPVKEGYKIDSESDVIMQAAPPLPLVEAPPIEYAREIAAYLVRTEWQPYLTELAATNMQQQETIQLQREQLAAQAQVQTRLSPFSEQVAAAVLSRPRSVSPSGNPRGVHKSDQRRKTGKGKEKQASAGKPSGTPATPAPPAAQPSTPEIRVESQRPFAVAAATPIPATPYNPAASAPPTVPAAPEKPSRKPGFSGFPGPSAQSATAYCSDGCRVEGVGSDMVVKHRAPCFKEDGEPICFPPPMPSPPKLKKNCCPYCKAVTHEYLADCIEFQTKFPKWKTAAQPPPPPFSIAFPQSHRTNEDHEDDEDECFSG